MPKTVSLDGKFALKFSGRHLLLLVIFNLFCVRIACSGAEGKSGEIFPPTAAAQSAVNWKDGYFYIDGKPTIIRSGSIHYARVPRELWRDRIWRLKMMGFNTVQSYVFWNATEPEEGQWDLADNLDLGAWLSLLKEMNMYALVRVGPYACAEWTEGGYPAWLTVKPGMVQREMGPLVPYSDSYLNKIEGIVAKHQVNHGGSVFMVQLENEHSGGWGTQVADPYLKHLDDQARANGYEVPMFNSGLHHSREPGGEVPLPVDPSPWYSTEFWTDWIGRYGDMSLRTLSQKIRGTWKILAFGGAGYNYYMAHGGTDFGYSGTGEAPGVSYDFSAPIGEAGQFHNFYYPARRAAYFAQAFTPILVGSHNDPTFATSDQPDLRVTTRTNPGEGSVIFLDRFWRKPGTAPVAAARPEAAHHAPKDDPDGVLDTHVTVGNLTLPHQGVIKVAAMEPQTIVVNMPWTANASFESICTNVLLRQTIGTTDYLVCYGTAGDTGEVTLTRKAPSTAPAQFDFTYPKDATVTEVNLDSGDGRQAKLLVMNTDLTNRTWLAHDKLYIGPSFVLEDGDMEFPPAGGKATIYSASGKSEVERTPVTVPDLPKLSNWTWRDAAPERAPDFSTAGWLKSQGPQAIETYDGFENRYGWYRTTLHRDSAGPVSLRFVGQSGTFAPFLNGQPGAVSKLLDGQAGTIDLPNAKAGDNALAILVKANPRPKTTFSGPVGMILARGLWGGVTTDKAPTPVAVSWKKSGKATRNAVADDLAKPDYDDTAWTPLDASASSTPMTINRGTSWFRGVFTLTPDQVDSILQPPQFAQPPPAAKQKAPGPAKIIVYLNGQPLAEPVENVSTILVPGKNTILLEVESRSGKDAGALTLGLWHNSLLSRATWYFHGGLNDLDETAIIGRVTDWSDFLSHQPWRTGDPAPAGAPTFWKCTFAYHLAAQTRESVGLVTTGLKAGNVWLNGHNLGESPQIYPMYMPECWLKDGDNDLVVFDLYGNKPDQLQLSRYEDFSVLPPKEPELNETRNGP